MLNALPRQFAYARGTPLGQRGDDPEATWGRPFGFSICSLLETNKTAMLHRNGREANPLGQLSRNVKC